MAKTIVVKQIGSPQDGGDRFEVDLGPIRHAGSDAF